MKRFLLKVSVFLLLLLLSFGGLFFLADGYTDPFYLKFTTPRQGNLIIGTSRAAQGLQPEILNKSLERSFFNFAFTIVHSPFGPVYLESIQKKVDTTVSGGIFIIAVDPWSISSGSANPDDEKEFRENDHSLAYTSKMDRWPNFEYLFKALEGNYYRLLPFPAEMQLEYLHDDGWLEVKLDADTLAFERRSLQRSEEYRNNFLPQYNYSSVRVDYLEQTVSFLKQYGEVYLVRLPVHPYMAKVEHEYMPDFDQKIADAIELSDGYCNLMDNAKDFLYTDANHLHRDSGKLVSSLVSEFIASKTSKFLANDNSKKDP